MCNGTFLSQGGDALPKLKNPHLILMVQDGQRVGISQDEYDLSPDEWRSRRKTAFSRLRKVGGIPLDLLDLVEHFEEQTLVQLYVHRPTQKVELKFEVKVLPNKKDVGRKRKSTATAAEQPEASDGDRNEGMTASEALALFLKFALRNLKHAESNLHAAPVRTLKLVPRSLIAEIAMDLMESCQMRGRPPGSFLGGLFRELLDLDRDRQAVQREAKAKERAARILSCTPMMGTRELAKLVHVNASTISRWRRNPEFQALVAQREEAVRSLAAGLSEKQMSQLRSAAGIFFAVRTENE